MFMNSRGYWALSDFPGLDDHHVASEQTRALSQIGEVYRANDRDIIVDFETDVKECDTPFLQILANVDSTARRNRGKM
jgi:hypothetical protein